MLLTCDAAQNRLLLFVVDHSGSLINEYDLTKTYRLNEHITNPASAVVDGVSLQKKFFLITIKQFFIFLLLHLGFLGIKFYFV